MDMLDTTPERASASQPSDQETLDSLASRVRALRNEQAELARQCAEIIETLGSDRAAAEATAIRREIQEAALIHLPLLLGDVSIESDTLRVLGLAVVPKHLVPATRFFVNGWCFDGTEFPLLDESLSSRFSEIRGTAAFRAVLKNAEILSSRFLRFEMSSTGSLENSNWRHVIWMPNPKHVPFPYPPPENMRRVVGDDSVARFAMGGATIFQNVAAYLRQMGRDIAEFPSILDWGCGAGRITRFLISETNAAVSGADIDEDNIRWCSENLKGGTFTALSPDPPMPYSDASMDLVIGASVLTHLSEESQFRWLAELRRVTRPGALLFLSVAGATQFAHQGFSVELYRRVQTEGFVDQRPDMALVGHVADPESYRTVWHSRAYILAHWSRLFDVIAIAEGIAATQDFVVLRRRTD